MKSIDDHLKACSPANNVYTYSFTQEEVLTINKALEKKAWIDEVKELLREGFKEYLLDKIKLLPQYPAKNDDIKGWLISYYDVVKLVEDEQ